MNGKGNGSANVLTGNTGNNWLDGGTSVDTLKGGQGDDTYTVDYTDYVSVYDTVVENNFSGTDTVLLVAAGQGVWQDYTLPDYVENVIVFGSKGSVVLGNTLDNLMIGSSKDDVLNGKSGKDSLTGGLGNDVYYVDNIDDKVTEKSGQGTDLVYSTISYSLTANVENLILYQNGNFNATGNDLNNRLSGNSGDNVLNGGTGVDTLKGGQGNDNYLVDNSLDVIIENQNEGIDSVQATSNYSLSAHIENLTLIGASALQGIGNSLGNTLVGNEFDNVFMGMDGADTIEGGLGNDQLWGASGNDVMSGGGGDDDYGVNDSGDVVNEDVNGGIDTVYATVNWSLGSNFEKLVLISGLTLTGTGNELDNFIQGNFVNNTLSGGAGADTIEGGDGNDEIYGGLGADVLKGGSGDDSYKAAESGDTIIEDFSGGIDTVVTSDSWELEANVEILQLVGNGNTNGKGNSLDNLVSGNLGVNVLSGLDGNDTLIGNDGSDTLVGGAGADTFIFETIQGGTDVITDFVSGLDRLVCPNGQFYFHIGNGDHTIDNAVLCNSTVSFAANAELVIIGLDINQLSAGAAAARIGSANSAYAISDTRLFVVDNGADSALYLFQSSGNDAQVSAAELTLIGTIQGAGQTALADYSF
ncbi:calcium-binding protein [Methylocucumis oryzae]|uniref:calcium-binding protein n=1 Tax=Methylocucumis oryzae TaxID=1632867 RepID=UPI0023BB0692|nr:calcium-binding protein [Methylocucumis oryzae]